MGAITPNTRRYVTEHIGRIEAWLQAHLDLIVFAAVAIGLLLRARAARGTYLNPDEALHCFLARLSSPFATYKTSLTNAHPPFFFLLLYFWRFLGRSEFILRLPSVLAGTAFLWVAFKWLEKVWGRTVGVIGLILLAFSPAMISLSAEVRSYALMLFFMAGALYFLERAFTEKSKAMMLRFSLFLYLAILTHYSAAWFTLAVGVYSLARILGRELPGRAVRVWASFQAGAVALYAFLYATHISKLRGSALEQEAVSGWVRPFYFHYGEDNLTIFALERSSETFTYVFGHPVLGEMMLLLFLASVALLLRRGELPGQDKPISRYLGILLLFPFVIGCGAAVAGFYPYGGSRHTAFLVPFAVAGVSFLIAKLTGQRLWTGLLAAAAVAGAGNLWGVPHRWQINPQDQSRILMSEAVNYVRQSIPPGGLIFLDYQSTLLFGHYLCGPDIIYFDTSVPGFVKSNCGSYQVVSAKVWAFNTDNFAAHFEKMTRAYSLKPGEQVWVVQAGWGAKLHSELPRRFPEFKCLAPQGFGENIGIFQLTVGSSFLPIAPTVGC